MSNENPLLAAYDIPPFDQIKPEHFVPAIEHEIAQAEKAFEQLRDATSPADFENTVMPLSALLHGLTRIKYIADNFDYAEGSEEMSAAYMGITQRISNFTKTVFQDQKFAARFREVPQPLTEEDQMLYKRMAFDFEASGAFLDKAGQARIRAIDNQLITLYGAFKENLRGAAKQQAVLFTDPADVAGVPDDVLFGFREAADNAGHKEGWLVQPERLRVLELLPIAESHHFRESIFKALDRIGTEEPFNNEPLLKDIQQLRYERANLLGYPHHAAYALSRNMPGDLATAETLLDEVGNGALQKFTDTTKKVQAFATANGGPRKLEPWDIAYWANLYRKEVFKFDEEKFKEYFPLDKVIEGFFKTAEATFGIRFTENSSYPRYDEDVRTYDVTDAKTGENLGILYSDLFKRSSKGDGACALQMQDATPGKPNIVSMNQSLPKPAAGKMPRLSMGDVETLFHEGGHTLDALLGTRTRHTALHGLTSTPEYAEFFSMMMENWPHQKACLDSFARHYETGEPIPDDLLKAYTNSQQFFSEHASLRIIQNSKRDFAFHSMRPEDYTDSAALQKVADYDHPLAAHLCAYSLPRFSHLVVEDGAYAAGYYGYAWSQAMAALAFKPFEQNGLSDPAACERLKTMYGHGSSRDKKTVFAECCGMPATAEMPEKMAKALLESIGADKPSRLARAEGVGRQ